jgi:hypothetical protein
VQLLYYRAWRGRLSSPHRSVWPIARLSLSLIDRRWLFLILYGLALLMFLLFFFGQYLLFAAESELESGGSLTVTGFTVTPQRLVDIFRKALKFNGSGETYRNYIWFQGYMTMIILALAGTLIVGNDFRHGSLSFYLSKPLTGRHYFAGKFLAVAVVINRLTTLPALVLFFQYALLAEYDYFSDEWPLLFGIIGYGMVLTVVLGVLVLATAVAVRRTVPLIMIWTTLFFFFRVLSGSLVDQLGWNARWKLIDLWNDMYILGNAMLGLDAKNLGRGAHPELLEAALVLGVVSVSCLIYLIRQIRAVEIVS